MEVSMATAISENRGRFWPVLLVVLGSFSIVDYFYKLSLQPDDLLVGLGFLLMVPLAYLYPSAFQFKANPARSQPAPWASWLSLLGVLLVIFGFVLQWL